jgi:1-acyl-sn-glycerol-3-phosphate acyltransferase
MTAPIPNTRLHNFDNVARVTAAMANDFEQFGPEPLLVKGLMRPLESIDRKLQGVLGVDPTVDAALGAVRLEIDGIRGLAASDQLDAAAVASRLRSASEGLASAERGAQQIGDPFRHALVPGVSDKALSPSAWAALDSIEPYSTIVRQERTPLQSPLMKVFSLARQRGVGDHLVVGADRIPSDPGVLFAPNHTGLYDMTLLQPLRASGDLRPMKVAGYTKMRRLVVDPILSKAGAFTVEAGSKPVKGTDGVTKGDMGIAVSARMLKDNQNVLIYPQGNIEPFDTVSSLYDGAVRASLESGRPIVPVANWGSNPAARWSDAGRGAVTVIGKPIDVSGARGAVSRHNIGVVGDQLQRQMLDLLDEARATHRQHFGTRAA